VNDIDAIQTRLIKKLKIGIDRIERLASPLDGRETEVPEKRPTLANIRAALEKLGTEKVKAGDRVFIYYSGHGTQAQVVEPDGTAYVREALLPFDFIDFTQRRKYLFDWELNALLARIAARTTSITVVLDACCSGGATRDAFDPPGSRARFWPADEPYVLEAHEAPPGRASLRGVADSIPATVQACHVVTACLSDELARESTRDGGIPHGELTRSLLAQLDGLPDDALAELRWGRIWRAVAAGVAAINPAQHPWISGGFARLVFGGPPEDGDVGYGVSVDGDTYRLQVGALSGVTEGAEVAIYGSEPLDFPPIGSPEDRPLGRLRVTRAGPSSAEATRIGAKFDLPKQGARARLVSAAPAARLRVALVPHDKDIAAAISSSPLLEVAAEATPGDVALQKRSDGGWAVTDDVFGKGEKPGEPVLAVLPPELLALAPQVLEQYYRYSLPLRLARECHDLPRVLRVKLLDCNQLQDISLADAQNPSKLPREARAGHLAPYQFKGGDEEGGGDKVCVLVENTSGINLSVWLIACTNSGKAAVISQARIPARAMHVFWEGDTLGRPFRLWLRPGMDVAVDRLVVIGTTDKEASLWHLNTRHGFSEILNAKGDDTESGKVPRAVAEATWTSTITTYRLER
jgi:hypothetical protein